MTEIKKYFVSFEEKVEEKMIEEAWLSTSGDANADGTIDWLVENMDKFLGLCSFIIEASSEKELEGKSLEYVKKDYSHTLETYETRFLYRLMQD